MGLARRRRASSRPAWPPRSRRRATSRTSSPSTATSPALRTRLLELEVDCAFNLCESLVGDARLESAVPLVLELLGIPFTGSPPEVLSFALRKDRVKQRLEAAGHPHAGRPGHVSPGRTIRATCPSPSS